MTSWSLFTAAMAIMTATLASAAARLPTCLEDCDLSKSPTNDCCSVSPGGCLAGPCGTYQGCVAEAKGNLDACLGSGAPECQPGRPGRCTVILEGCVRPCEKRYKRAVQRCRRELVATMRSPGATPCPGCIISGRRARQALLKACNEAHCASASTTTTLVPSTTTVVPGGATTTTATTSGTTTTRRTTTTLKVTTVDDACLNACILRIDSVGSCYADCEDACDGNRNALKICRQSCRNFQCGAIRQRCAEREGPSDNEEYLQCCDPRGTCIPPDEAPCEETTTTTSSSTTTMSTTSLTTTTTITT